MQGSMNQDLNTISTIQDCRGRQKDTVSQITNFSIKKKFQHVLEVTQKIFNNYFLHSNIHEKSCCGLFSQVKRVKKYRKINFSSKFECRTYFFKHNVEKMRDLSRIFLQSLEKKLFHIMKLTKTNNFDMQIHQWCFFAHCAAGQEDPFHFKIGHFYSPIYSKVANIPGNVSGFEIIIFLWKIFLR